MRRVKLALIGVLGGLTIGGALLVSRPAPAFAAPTAAFKCPNTYCGPGSLVCSEYPNTGCSMDGGCAGWSWCT